MYPPPLQLETTEGLCGAGLKGGDGEDGCDPAMPGAVGNAGGVDAPTDPMPVAAIEGDVPARNSNAEAAKNFNSRFMIFTSEVTGSVQ
jgi:hypothetical protein